MNLPPEYRDYLKTHMSLAERFRDAFSTTDERLDFLNATMLRILAALGGEPVPGPTPGAGFLSSRSDFMHGQATVVTAGTAVQLSSGPIMIPNGYPLVVIAWPTNAGVIYVANSKAGAEVGQYFNGLDAGLALSLLIDDVSKVWVNASADSQKVSWIVER